MSVTDTLLRFSPFQSTLEASFWNVLSKKKLDEYGLDDQIRPISAHYTNGRSVLVQFFK